MKYDLVIRGSRVVTEQGVYKADIGVKKGKIAALVDWGLLPSGEEEIDARGLLLLPGGVDPHVHFNEPGRGDWEGWEHGSRAAAAGGVTTVLEMPLNSTPPIINSQNLRAKQKVASTLSCVDYGLWGGLVDDNLSDLPGLEELGVIGYKAFMSESGVDFSIAHDGILYEGLQYVAKSGSLIGVHAENDCIAAQLTKKLKAAGKNDRRAWGESHPPAQELEGVNRLLFLVKHTGGRAHVVHVSLAEAISLIYEGKMAGLPLSVETCGHYLWFDEEDFIRIGPAAKCDPPIRNKDNKEALWKMVLDGKVDCIASDHSPSETSLKTKGNDNIWEAWGGIIGIQAFLPILLTEGVHRRGMPLPLLAKLWSGGAARIFGLYGQKGLIALGADADFVIVDLEQEWKMTEDKVLSRHKISPYVNCQFKGAVVKTFVRGKQVFGEGSQSAKGWGKLIIPKKEDNGNR